MKLPSVPSYSQGAQDKALLSLTLGQAFDQTCMRYPDGEALIVRHQQQRLTWQQLAHAVDLHARAFMALGMAMKRYSFRFAWGRAAVTGVLCLCLAGSSFSAVYNYAHKPFRANDRHRQAAQWLVDHGYDKGYASYYHANVLTELSSGQLETWAMLTYADDEAHPFLQTMDHLQEAP